MRQSAQPKATRCYRNGIFDAKYCLDDAPKCSEIDPPEVMVGEYLPYRWDLEMPRQVDTQATDCSELRGDTLIP